MNDIKKALLIVDVQNDFCPNGALAVENGDKIIPVINSIADKFDIVIASKDWHPSDSVHFDKWPKHCIAETTGAELHPELDTDKIDLILLKGTQNKDDGYSAFDATNTNLNSFLREQKITHLYICGLATDYCVRATTIDACNNGFHTLLITDAIAAVNMNEGDDRKALNEMYQAGCCFVEAKDV